MQTIEKPHDKTARYLQERAHRQSAFSVQSRHIPYLQTVESNLSRDSIDSGRMSDHCSGENGHSSCMKEQEPSGLLAIVELLNKIKIGGGDINWKGSGNVQLQDGS